MKGPRLKTRWILFTRWLGSLADIEDVLYVVGVVACSAGAWQFHPGAGLFVGGVMIALAPLLSMLRGGPPRKG